MANKSNKSWISRHINDPYVKKAQAEGYPSRSAYKLLELQEKYKILKPGMRVVDVGAAPGGWSMVAKDIVGDKGQVIALDVLPLQITSQVEFIQGDFTEDAIYQQLMTLVGGHKIDVVISDIAPEMSGMRSVDQPKSMYLVELAWDFATQVLRPGGSFLCKFFEGEGSAEFMRSVRQQAKVKTIKPKSSRTTSREMYLLAQLGRHTI